MEQIKEELNEPNEEHLKILKNVFGLQKFRQNQWKAIDAIINQKRDVFLVASTGYGKSLIFQYPPIFLNRRVIVVSPLNSLMMTQVMALKQIDINAIYFPLNSMSQIMNMKLDDYQIIYTTPENLHYINKKLLLENAKDSICMVAIDECHSVSKKSSDYREPFGEINQIKELFPNVPIACLTSTATTAISEDIVTYLNLDKPLMLRTSFDRPNITYIVRKKTKFMNDVKSYILEVTEGCGIIFVYRREDTHTIASLLNSFGVQAKYYHGGMSELYRTQTLREFMEGQLKFIVSTPAISCGLDKSDVRLVIHYGAPKNLEMYYQDSGRAGRDGKPAKSVVVWSPGDYSFHDHWLNTDLRNTVISNQDYAHRRNLMHNMRQYLNTTRCRRAELLGQLNGIIPNLEVSETCCDNCLAVLHTRIALNLMHNDIGADGNCDVSTDARTILRLIREYKGKCIETDLYGFLTGTIPSKRNHLNPLHFFRVDISKSEGWYCYIMKLIKSRKFVVGRGRRRNYQNFAQIHQKFLKVTRKGRHFLRHKNLKIKEKPSPEIYAFMKKSDKEYFIENNEVKSRPRVFKPQIDLSQLNFVDIEMKFKFNNNKQNENKNLKRKKQNDQSKNGNGSKAKIPRLEIGQVRRAPDEKNPGCSHWIETKTTVTEQAKEEVDDKEAENHQRTHHVDLSNPSVALVFAFMYDRDDKGINTEAMSELPMSAVIKEDEIIKAECGDDDEAMES